ncbi:hypothetical protein HDV05_007248 [Chytridiales sp. JEL 0842]|nr:hypothetical protein HDV05_007248 [Chytridiales sp. JEL 0842]
MSSTSVAPTASGGASSGDSSNVASNSKNPMDAHTILTFALNSLTKPPSASSTQEDQANSSSSTSSSASASAQQSESQLNSPSDVLLLLFHGTMTRLGFQFRGLGESDSSSSVSAVQQEGGDPFQPLPTEWNQTPDSYAFRYTHPQSTFTFLLKALKIASKLLIHGLAIQDGKLYSLELSLPAFISETFKFPIPASALLQPQEQNLGEGWIERHSLGKLFVNLKALEEALFEFKTKIIDYIMPNINKPGYEPVQLSTPSQQQQPSQQRPEYRDPLRDPLFDGRYGGGVPRPFGGDPMAFPGAFGGRSPYAIGDVDLDPLAAAPGVMGPRVGWPGASGMHPGGGMFVGPDHPMFGGGPGGFGGVPRPNRGGFYPSGGPGAPPLPPGAVPPGARFDHIVPPQSGPTFGRPPSAGGMQPPPGGRVQRKLCQTGRKSTKKENIADHRLRGDGKNLIVPFQKSQSFQNNTTPQPHTYQIMNPVNSLDFCASVKVCVAKSLNPTLEHKSGKVEGLKCADGLWYM